MRVIQGAKHVAVEHEHRPRAAYDGLLVLCAGEPVQDAFQLLDVFQVQGAVAGQVGEGLARQSQGTTDDAGGWEVLQFTSAIPFTTTETGSDSYANGPGTYRIRYRQVTGDALAALLAAPQNAGKTSCWNFVFVSASGTATQPQAAYCR